MNLIDNKLYLSDIKNIAELNLPWHLLENSNILISGASGLIGSFLIDVIMHNNKYFNLNCKVYALGRNTEKAHSRFECYWENKLFEFISHDINYPLELNIKVQYVIHLASNTHPMAYSTDPIGTITTNIIGLKNLLDFSESHGIKRFAFASSNEIYGENRGDVEKFKEDYCGYINCNTMRAGYPESKRCGESLCQAYIKQKKIDIVIPRLTRSYGPTLLDSDTKAMSQFIKRAVSGKDIVLKSEGNQYYSYTYVADAVSGLLTVLLKGKTGEAYNISDSSSDIKLKDLAKIVAETVDKKVIFEIPEKNEKDGYSTATKARLDNSKLVNLDWKALYSIETGIKNSISIMRDLA